MLLEYRLQGAPFIRQIKIVDYVHNYGSSTDTTWELSHNNGKEYLANGWTRPKHIQVATAASIALPWRTSIISEPTLGLVTFNLLLLWNKLENQQLPHRVVQM